MMRCHICGKLLECKTLEEYFKEVLEAHFENLDMLTIDIIGEVAHNEEVEEEME
ncbi:MAG: hypothetical protein ACTSSE_16130 [Candidatus Thorarchaeota archaeon]